ncbi:transcription repressor OFP14-like [Gossypium arboreum]|uniref:Transcription repressor n=1 Tax=Gossypium arboreum TaxID=29729 RepID=A0ABR0QW15_GOSAR|nr:transcription repressor OFP14-like [Gossypium arboreum]KAK5843062.1 hypothetical protein PVK06_005493 [Gossypium arboreum]
MSKKLQKSLQDYLSKIKKPSPNTHFLLNSFSSNKWIPKGCKNPQTLSFSVHQDGEAATLSDVDRFLFENFKSLYINDDDDDDEIKDDDGDGEVKSPGGICFESPRFIDPPPYLSGSNRFFVATGFSSSLIEEARNSGVTGNTFMSMSEDAASSSTSISNTSSTTANESNVYGGGSVNVKSQSIYNECIAVLRCSPNPYDDFRRSMQEMVEARLKHGSKIDWDFMEELLFCYLNLNDKMSYKFVLSAFVDLVVDLRQNDGKMSRNSNVKYKRSRRTRHGNVA